MNVNTSELIADELELTRRFLPLAGARVIDLGCGAAEMPRRLLKDSLVASVTGLEVDEVQHARNLAAVGVAGLGFVYAGADDIPFDANSFDTAMMFKSLHHVSLDRLERALAEIERVRLFNDEEVVRKAAYDALGRAVSTGLICGSTSPTSTWEAQPPISARASTPPESPTTIALSIRVA